MFSLSIIIYYYYIIIINTIIIVFIFIIIITIIVRPTREVNCNPTEMRPITYAQPPPILYTVVYKKCLTEVVDVNLLARNGLFLSWAGIYYTITTTYYLLVFIIFYGILFIYFYFTMIVLFVNDRSHGALMSTYLCTCG